MAYSILIVDDDRTFVEELKSALQWNRLRITEVYTAFSVSSFVCGAMLSIAAPRVISRLSLIHISEPRDS